MIEIQKDSRGKTKNTICKCKECNIEFRKHSWDSKQFCSRDCFYNYTKRFTREIKNCASCGSVVQVRKYSIDRNELNYCNRECYNNRRKPEDLKRLKRGTKFYKELINNSICNCGISDNFLLQIHHRDGNHNNNTTSNLEILCSNCHIKRHLKLDVNNNIVHNPKSLTTKEIIDLLNIQK